jgi:DNA-binding NarL/FixJ family response regulator
MPFRVYGLRSGIGEPHGKCVWGGESRVTSVLVVDPDPAIRALAAEILERAGAVCTVGDNPRQAPHLATVNRPDAVLLSIGPSLEGIEAARTIKAERPKTVVVLLAGHGEDAYLGSTGKTGADALLPKRALPQTLLATLRRLDRPVFGKLWDGRERRQKPPGRRKPQERRRPPSPPEGTIAAPRLDIHAETSGRRPSLVREPSSGLSRIPFAEPCELHGVKGRYAAKICDLSAAGVYVALEPVPDIGENFVISFPLPGRPVPLSVESVVRWHNARWDRRVLELPPGCGMRFLSLTSPDLQQIHTLVSNYVTSLPRLPWAPGH